MIDIKDKHDCCGCTACSSVCPQKAITMKPDDLGFLYPKVDKTKCTNCGLCDKVCAFNDNYDKTLNISEPIAYAARHKDMSEMMKSRSGGAFAVLSDYILGNGGVVYGAGYEGHFVVKHKQATTKEERDEFRGSKYVQSDLSGIFQQIKEDLKEGLTVLFSGTPCQTAGLNSFIGKALRQNLYLVDIICHGVPGPYVWRDYLAYLEKKYKKEIITVNFRDKEHFGWEKHFETISFKGFDTPKSFDNYAYIFNSCATYRLSCGICHYTNLVRPSDITIGDFWGVERTDSEFGADNKGCSLVLCNTEKGKKIFEIVKHQMNTINAQLINVMQHNLYKPALLPKYRIDLENDYSKLGFEKTMKKYGLLGIKKLIIVEKKQTKHFVKKVIKKIFGEKLSHKLKKYVKYD